MPSQLIRSIFPFLFIAFSTYLSSTAQQPGMVQFAIWKPHQGQAVDFENGYKRHLEWHRANGDRWSWHGWYFISGERYGQFIDATFHHKWSDFDAALKPAEDMGDNRINVFPYAEVQSVFKARELFELSNTDTFNFTSRFCRLLTIKSSQVSVSTSFIRELKNDLLKSGIRSFHVFQMVDGDSPLTLLVMIGLDNWKEYEKSEEIDRTLRKVNPGQYDNLFSIKSETIAYRPDLSYFPGK